MSNKFTNISPECRQRFNAACTEAFLDYNKAKGIGTLGEKSVHAILKSYLEPDPAFHEVKVGKFVADIKKDTIINEIQTRNFNALKNKLDFFLEEHEVTIVYPLPHIKYLKWISPETGELSEARKSTKKGTAYMIFRELYKIKPYLANPRLHLRIILFDADEYRILNGWSRDRKKGAAKHDIFPKELISDIAIDSLSDYALLLPDELAEVFTVKDYQKAAHITQQYAQPAVNVLCHLGIIEHIGKKGRAYLYRKTNKKPIESIL